MAKTRRHAWEAIKHARKQDKARDILRKAIKHARKQDKSRAILWKEIKHVVKQDKARKDARQVNGCRQ